LQIPMDLHRVQVEYELREKLILLRQHLLLADANETRLWEVVLRSVSSLSTLFRHTLIALGDSASTSRREAVAALAQRVGFDGGSILRVLDVREGKADRKKIDIVDLAARYLASVEKVIAAVDMASA